MTYSTTAVAYASKYVSICILSYLVSVQHQVQRLSLRFKITAKVKQNYKVSDLEVKNYDVLICLSVNY